MVVLQSEQFINRYPDPNKITVHNITDVTHDTQGKIISCVTFNYDTTPYVEYICVDQDENCDAKDTALSWLFWQRKIFGPKTPSELLNMSDSEFEKNIYALCYKN